MKNRILYFSQWRRVNEDIGSNSNTYGCHAKYEDLSNNSPDPSNSPDSSSSEESSESEDGEVLARLSGSYTVPSDISSRGDALHSFDTRKKKSGETVKWGGRMCKGWESEEAKSVWGKYVKLDQGVGINQKLKEFIKRGINPDVANLNVEIEGYKVTWSVDIVKSTDGIAWSGVATRGSIGDGAKSRMEGQIPVMKQKNKNLSNWTKLDFEFTGHRGIYQQWWKYTG